jgi:hypothetical protein
MGFQLEKPNPVIIMVPEHFEIPKEAPERPYEDEEQEEKFIEASVRANYLDGLAYFVTIIMFLVPIVYLQPAAGFLYLLAAWVYAISSISRRSPLRNTWQYWSRWVTYFFLVDAVRFGIPVWIFFLGRKYFFAGG